MMKITGKRLSLTLARDGACHSRVKKSLKNTVKRQVRTRLRETLRKEMQNG